MKRFNLSRENALNSVYREFRTELLEEHMISKTCVLCYQHSENLYAEDHIMSFQDYLNQSISVSHLEEIDLNLINELGIKGLVVDFDGVLGGARTESAPQWAIDWFRRCLEAGLKLAIHSNNPEIVGKHRRERLLQQLPAILWMPTHPKKPNPSTLKYLQGRWRLQHDEIAMVDDRMLTGGQAAYRAKTRFIYVRDAVSDYNLAPVLEFGFSCLRVWERLIYRSPEKWCIREDSNL